VSRTILARRENRAIHLEGTGGYRVFLPDEWGEGKHVTFRGGGEGGRGGYPKTGGGERKRGEVWSCIRGFFVPVGQRGGGGKGSDKKRGGRKHFVRRKRRKEEGRSSLCAEGPPSPQEKIKKKKKKEKGGGKRR